MFKCTLKIIFLKLALFGIALVLGLILVLVSPLFLVNMFPVSVIADLIYTLGRLHDRLEVCETLNKRFYDKNNRRK